MILFFISIEITIIIDNITNCEASWRETLTQNKVNKHTSAFTASKTAPETGSGQNSSGEKLHSTLLSKGRLIAGHTCKRELDEHTVHERENKKRKRKAVMMDIDMDLHSDCSVHKHILGKHEKITQGIQEREAFWFFGTALIIIV